MIKWLCTNKIVGRTLLVIVKLTSDKRNRFKIIMIINGLAAILNKTLFKIAKKKQIIIQLRQSS